MPERAHVTSVEALDAFRTSLLVYADKARAAIDEVQAETLRLRLWLQSERRTECEREIRRCARDLEQARRDLAAARLSRPPGMPAPDQNPVKRALHALRQAEARHGRVKAWGRQFELQTEALAPPLARAGHALFHTVPRAAAFLAEAVRTLEAYTETAAAPVSVPDETPAATKTA